MDAFWGAVTACFGSITAALAYMANRNAKHARKAVDRVDDAVNHRHQYDGNPPRLYDIALENRRRLNDNEFAHANLFEAVDRITRSLEAHVEWEEQNKYEEIMHQIRELKNERSDG